MFHRGRCDVSWLSIGNQEKTIVWTAEQKETHEICLGFEVEQEADRLRLEICDGA